MPKPLLQLVIQSSSPIWFLVAWSQQQVRCMHCRSRRCLNCPHLIGMNVCVSRRVSGVETRAATIENRSSAYSVDISGYSYYYLFSSHFRIHCAGTALERINQAVPSSNLHTFTAEKRFPAQECLLPRQHAGQQLADFSIALFHFAFLIFDHCTASDGTCSRRDGCNLA